MNSRNGENVEASIIEVTRQRNTRLGNPVYDIHTSIGATYRTQANAACAYNSPEQWVGHDALLSLTPAGRVFDVRVKR